MSLPEDLKQHSQKKHKSMARTSVNIPIRFPWYHTCKRMNSDTHRLFFPNKQTVLWRWEKKDEKQFMAWEKGYYKVSCLPQGKSAFVTSKVEKAEHSKQGLDDCFKFRWQGEVCPQKSDHDLQAWVARGDKGWHKCVAVWSTLMGHYGSLQPRHLRTCREELHQKAIISLRWWLIHCGIRSLCKSQNLAFFIIKNTHYGKKSYSVCRKRTVH